MKCIIGITGSIACGKSFVSNYLSQKGYCVIDTDKISHEITLPNEIGYLEIKKHFPTVIENETINRKKLADLIFNNALLRQELNNILHPIIKKRCIDDINKSNEKLIFLDVPLLFEAGFDDLCNTIICVSVSKDIQIQRLIERDNISYEEAIKKIDSQMDLKEKMARSHYIINNDFDHSTTIMYIEEILNKLKEKYYA